MTAITTPIAAQSIHEGKNEPITLICGPMASPYRSGAGLSPVLNANVAADCSSWTFVSSSTKRARLSSRRAARRSVRVPSPRRYDASESSYACCDASSRAAATSRRRYASLTSVYAFQTSLTARSRVAVISSSADRRADSASSTRRCPEPFGRLVVRCDPRLTQDRPDVADERHCRPVCGARPADFGLGRAERRYPSEEIQPLLERAVDGLLDRVLDLGAFRKVRKIRDLDRYSRRDADTLRERHLGVPLLREHVLEVEHRLRCLLSRERDLGASGESPGQPALRRLLHRAGRVERALGHCDPRANAGEAIERALHGEGDLLVLAVESEIRGQEPLLRGVPSAPAASEVEQQPAQIQGGHRLE